MPLLVFPPDQGVLFVISGPSGVGKSTLIQKAIEQIPNLTFSVSATTRAPRPGEIHGREYHFLEREEFERRVQGGEFLENATVYQRRYGTLLAPTLTALEAGQSLILDIDVQGARQIRTNLAKLKLQSAAFIFILPPQIALLEARLRARQSDSEEIIQGRMKQVAEQLLGCPEFDYAIINADLETAVREFQGILLAEINRTSRRQNKIKEILKPLQV